MVVSGDRFASGTAGPAAPGAGLPRAWAFGEARSRSPSLWAEWGVRPTSLYLECRLQASDDRVDIMGAISREAARRVRFVEGRGVEWFAFLRVWTADKSPIRARIPHVWLSLDLPPGYGSPAVPGMLLCLDPRFSMRPGLSGEPNAVGIKELDSILQVLRALFPACLTGDRAGKLKECVDRLPEQGEILHVSLMPGRTPRAVKINLAMPKTAIAEYLHSIGWEGCFPHVRNVLQDFVRDRDKVKFQLTLGEPLLPRVEFEFDFARPPAGDPRLPAILDACRDWGIAADERLRCLPGWLGKPPESVLHGILGRREMRWLDIKLSLEPTKAPEGKAYLGTWIGHA